MKITVPPLELEEFEGFSPANDIFRRKEFAEQLTNLVKNTDGELVIGLDAAWGQGKTTFVKMWRGGLQSAGVPSIYFDAFENDYEQEPILSLVSEIYSLLEAKNKTSPKAKLKSSAVAVLKRVSKIGLRVGLRAASAGVVDDTVFENTGIGDELCGTADEYLEERLETHAGDKNVIGAFRNTLSEVVESIGGGKLVFIIDELDRCNPLFALRLLESIKHVFNVSGIAFVLVLNREQIHEVVKIQYGSGVDSAKYLQKFVHLWVGLPVPTEPDGSNSVKYLHHCLEQMGFQSKTTTQQNAIAFYAEIVEHYRMSLRDVERSLTNFAIIQNLRGADLRTEYQWLAIYLSIVKVLFPSTFAALCEGEKQYAELVAETQLDGLSWRGWGDKPLDHPVKWLLSYALGNESDREILLKQGHQFDRTHGLERVVETTCRWLQNLQ